jgi:hypothetical protein
LVCSSSVSPQNPPRFGKKKPYCDQIITLLPLCTCTKISILRSRLLDELVHYAFNLFGLVCLPVAVVVDQISSCWTKKNEECLNHRLHFLFKASAFPARVELGWPCVSCIIVYSMEEVRYLPMAVGAVGRQESRFVVEPRKASPDSSIEQSSGICLFIIWWSHDAVQMLNRKQPDFSRLTNVVLKSQSP